MMLRTILLAVLLGVFAIAKPDESAVAKAASALSFGAEIDTTHALAANGSQGKYPSNSMLIGSDGNLYGTTFGNAGDSLYGVFYKVIPSWTTPSYTVLHTFRDGSVANDGFWCSGKIVQDGSGYIYGTCQGGGASTWYGTVYRINTSNGAVTILHSFGGTNDGSVPVSGLVRDASGNLYGTTNMGDGNCSTGYFCGTIFKLAPSGGGWSYSILHRFAGGTNGEGPHFLTLGSDGNLYGTAGGGTNNTGIIFKYNLNGGGFTKLLNMPSDEAVPFYGGITQIPTSFASGVMQFWGIADLGNTYGCGTIFKISDTGGGVFSYTTMHEFNCITDVEGEFPYTDLVFTTNLRDSGLDAGGALYGTTLLGGQTGSGSFFRIDLSGNFWDMHKTPGSVTYSDDMGDGLWGLVQGSIPYGTSTKQVLFGGAQAGGLNGTGWLWHFWWYV